MGVETLVVILIGFMLIAALIAVETRDLLSSVICVGAAGFALSVIDLLLGAPDLAITQVAVEIIALVLLIRVILTRTDTSVPTHADALRTGLALLAGGLVLAAAFFAFGGPERVRGPGAKPAAGTVPTFGEPVLTHKGTDAVPPGVSRQYLGDPDDPNHPGAPEETGAANAVMAVLLDYRAYDTLGEATVIFVSILGAYAVLRHIGRKQRGST